MTLAGLSAIIGIGIAIMSHIVASVWWASKINTTMMFILKRLDDITTKNGKLEEKYDIQISALWRELDALKGIAKSRGGDS